MQGNGKMRLIMIILKSINVAFSLYSKIPMPHFAWASDDMKYHVIFFPWVGAVIGALEYGWYHLAAYMGAGRIMFLLIGMAIPLLITGGFHVDGFMDTMDAIHSYQDREKKLEILKDPHIGAFSVIMLALYGLLFLAFFSELADVRLFAAFAAMFALSRCLSGLSVICFPPAKKDGMLSVSANTAAKRICKYSLVLELCVCILFALLITPLSAFAILAMLLVFAWYRWMSMRQFGGITGDLAGFFVTAGELAAVAALALVNLLFLG